ncbi:MAG TPA: hypothetical protein PLC39_05730 [Methanomassiliicoccales archaeon]|nr:hypothetical protein [Methanomassiliicoccales archaeon]HPR98779.1 hypothetical protein [Methanomassiliicoccales archaeon]
MDDIRLRSRVMLWSGLSFLIFLSSLIMIFWGGPVLELEGRRIGIAQIIWLPGLIGSCSGLWLLLTLSGARGGISLSVALGNLAGAEALSLLLPVKEVSGMVWETGNGLVPATSFAALALTSLTWTAITLADPSRSTRTAYSVALAAVLAIGFLLSYNYLWSLQGAMAVGLAAALFWGMAYDRRLHPYSKVKVKKQGSPWVVLLITFLGLPMLLLGLPYLLL